MTKYNVGDIVSDGGLDTFNTRHIFILQIVDKKPKRYDSTYTGLILETGEILENMSTNAWDQARSVQLVA